MATTPSLRGETLAGVVMHRSGPAAAFAVAAVGLAAAVLAPFHLWTPVVVLPVLVVLLAVGWRLLLLVPTRPAPLWATGLTVAASLGFGIWAAATRAEQVVLRRDSGTYALYAHWLATQHGLPVDAHLDAFGGAAAALGVPGVTLASPGFFELTSSGVVLPQFLIGAPALYSLGWWAGGWTGLFVVPAILGAAALLAVGGLTARLVGPRWAPLAVVALGLTQPVLHAARTTWSEAPALVLVAAAGALLVDAVRDDDVGVAWIAGLLAGLAGLVRVDALREVALLVAVCGVLALRRCRVAVPLAGSALAGIVVAAVPAVWFSMPYLTLNRDSVLPLVLATGVVVVLAGLAAAVGRRRAVAAGNHDPTAEPAPVLATAGVGGGAVAAPESPPVPDRVPEPEASPDGGAVAWRRPLPLALGGLVAATGVALATRPWWMVARQAAPPSMTRGIADLQAQQGLPVDGTRTYAEQSVRWMNWYTGPVALLLALGTLTVLAVLAGVWWERSGRAVVPVPVWLVPAAVGLGSTVLVLYRPGITPDHPWADRRLVTVALPTVILAAVAAVAWAVRALRRRAPAAVFPAVAGLGVAALTLPAWLTTAPVATLATERGQTAAVQTVCASFEPQDVVVVANGGTRDGGPDRSTNEWPQVIRGVCGRPTVALLNDTGRAEALDRLATLAAGTGHRLVVLAAKGNDGSPPRHLLTLGLQPRRVVRLPTTEDRHLLDRPATGTTPLLVEVWTAPWPTRTAS